jgi:hypothetical protein
VSIQKRKICINEDINRMIASLNPTAKGFRSDSPFTFQFQPLNTDCFTQNTHRSIQKTQQTLVFSSLSPTENVFSSFPIVLAKAGKLRCSLGVFVFTTNGTRMGIKIVPQQPELVFGGYLVGNAKWSTSTLDCNTPRIEGRLSRELSMLVQPKLGGH